MAAIDLVDRSVILLLSEVKIVDAIDWILCLTSCAATDALGSMRSEDDTCCWLLGIVEEAARGRLDWWSDVSGYLI